MKRVLFSVTDKSGIEEFGKGLLNLFPQLEIIASGGTAATLEKAGIPHTCISKITQYPECFDGRVKTLHPAIHGGILFRRGVDEEEAKRLGTQPIDLVVCNLYAFNPNKKREELAASMDIGGPTMIRAACKNYISVAIVVDPSDYQPLLEELAQGPLSLATRERLTLRALKLSAAYEKKIADSFEGNLSSFQLENERKLSYGENPDQEGWVYSFTNQPGIASAKVLGGKPLSYNNYEDASQAFYALQRVQEMNAVGIVKHGGLCGFATGKTLRQAFQKAWEGDSKSAYGSIVAFSREVGEEFCEELKSRFVEVLLAPSFAPEFIAWAAKAKPSLRLLEVRYDEISPRLYRGISGGMLVQTPKKELSAIVEKYFQPLNGKVGVATKRQPKENQAGLFGFAIAAVQSVKSNAIVLVREYEPSQYQLVGVGGGQPNRVDSLQRLAVPKAIENLEKEGGDLHQALGQLVLASDGFFPFPDSVAAAASLGIQTFLQPGGSVQDNEVIKEADERGLCMIFTGQRYFNH